MTVEPGSLITPSPIAAGSERGPFVDLVSRERWFLIMMAVAFVGIGLVYKDAAIARWFGFAIAGYAVVANDSIQTIGTFIASNKNKPWWLLWMFIGGIFLVTMIYSWWAYDGDVTYQRLASKGFETTPMSFGYLQIAAPLVLLLLTRARMPVSTTFLLLTCFATEASSVGAVMTKSVAGYGVAFIAAILVWLAVSTVIEKYVRRGKASPWWRVGQWITTGGLWSVWLMQDAANVAVYLPRQLSVWELLGFLSVIFFGLGALFRFGGARVQKVVDEKSRITDVRAATVVDLVYMVVLYTFKIQSNIPMSTTWVFVGLLAGREVAMVLRGTGTYQWKAAFKLIRRDLIAVTLGLLISFALAVAVNDALRQALFG